MHRHQAPVPIKVRIHQGGTVTICTIRTTGATDTAVRLKAAGSGSLPVTVF
jgi:hypothetical protein